MLGSDTRGVAGVTGIIRVGLWLLLMLVFLWIFAIVGPAVLEPMYDFASSNGAVDSQGYGGTVDTTLTVALQHAPTLLGIGVILLVIAYAAFRERFSARRRRPR